MPKIKVFGLGPADEKLILPSDKEQILKGINENICVLRTKHHPASSKFIGLGATTFDYIYNLNLDRKETYKKIASVLVELAKQKGEIIYVVPGSPFVGEDSVSYLLNYKHEVDIEIYPAISFLELAWQKIDLDPIADSLSIVDGEQFSKFGISKSGPLLITQTYCSEIMSDIKLIITDCYDIMKIDRIPVTVLYHLGLDDEQIFIADLNDIDQAEIHGSDGESFNKTIRPDHLTSIFIDLPKNLLQLFADLNETSTVLRQKCPWDKKQTFESLTKNVLEECYELIDASVDYQKTGECYNLIEELGDLLYFVMIYSLIGKDLGEFNLNDVIAVLNEKLIRRHPNIFTTPEEINLDNFLNKWESNKLVEKNRTSVFEGIPKDLPALALLEKALKKASAARIDYESLIDGLSLNSVEKVLLDLTIDNEGLESIARNLALKLINRSKEIEA
jgi:tetrapyrrole methylase family protein/MazG family protein